MERMKREIPKHCNSLDRIRALENENKRLEEENENLKAIIEHYKKFEEWKERLEWMLMEEDTLQELRDLGKI